MPLYFRCISSMEIKGLDALQIKELNALHCVRFYPLFPLHFVLSFSSTHCVRFYTVLCWLLSGLIIPSLSSGSHGGLCSTTPGKSYCELSHPTAITLIRENHKLHKNVEADLRNLSKKLTTTSEVLDDAEDRRIKNKDLWTWLENLKDAAYDAEDILNTYATEVCLWHRKQQVRKIHRPFSLSQSAYKLKYARRIKKLLARLDKIDKEKDKFHLNKNSEPLYENRNTTPLVSTFEFVGREEDTTKIIDLLLSADADVEEGGISVVPIVGLGGLGKTTLAQVVYNDDRVAKSSHFEFRMWVCMTEHFDYSRILKDMIRYKLDIDVDLNLLSDSQLESRLLEILERKRFLLVLDDVWIESFGDWEKLRSVLRLGGKGSRVLITTRNERVSQLTGAHDAHVLGHLPEPQCIELFKKIAFNQNNLESSVRKDLEDIGEKIVQKCAGLPLAVKAMGGLLCGNSDINKWRSVLQHEIWEAEEWSTNTGKPLVLPALRLSYKHLPSHLKHCFGYCHIFPKGHVFDRAELVKLWKAASLIKPRGPDTLDQIGIFHFDELLARSFFQIFEIDGEKKYVMHDLMHDVAQVVSSPHCWQIKDNKPSDSHPYETFRHISLVCKDVEQPVLDVIIDKSKKVRTLVLPGVHMKDFGLILDNGFRALRYLCVLDLNSSALAELPKSVELLKLLRYLDLSNTEIRTLPNSICSLYNLQTLKLLRCLWLFELPKDFANFINLQHLELDEMFWYKLDALPPRIGRLTCLENLHTFRVMDKMGHGIDELKDMLCLSGAIDISNLEKAKNAGDANLKNKERLQKVLFKWSEDRVQGEVADETTLKDLQPHPNLEELMIVRYSGCTFPSWMSAGLVPNLVVLSLYHCTKCKVLSLGNLPKLRTLCIKGMLTLEVWTNAEYGSLDLLKISNCPKLKQLPFCFPILRALKIKECHSLKALSFTPSLRFLILMDNATLEDWEEVMSGVSYPNGQVTTAQDLQGSFEDVLELRIINCPKFNALPQFFYPQKLEICGCPLLTRLPTFSCSWRLQRLAIDGCANDSLVRAIPDTDSLYSLVISNISGLSALPKWPHLPGLKALYILGCKDLVSLSEEEEAFQGLNSLILLSVRDCPRLVTFPDNGLPSSLECLMISSCENLTSLGPKDVLKNLTSLTDLHIEDCAALQFLPEEGPPTSLQHLRIENCPLLTAECQEDTGPYWLKIKDIADLEIKSLEVTSASTEPVMMDHPSRRVTSPQHWACRKGGPSTSNTP